MPTVSRVARAFTLALALSAAVSRAQPIPPQIALYNAACAAAKAGDTEKAFAALEKAIAAGFTQVKLLESDPDLASLRSDARFGKLLATAKAAAYPCRTRPESRQLDFWVGEWDVTNPAGRKAGTSRIELILESCVVLESWTGNGGMTGQSFNAFHPVKKRWEQFWVDSSGDVQHFVDGEYKDGAMRFQTLPSVVSGKPGRRRLTFHNMAPDRVRQHSEVTRDDGATWTTEYDFTYTRKR
jgi:hypothetical protein